METKTEGPRNLAHILSEGNGNISRETVTIVSGAGVLKAGTVLGEITASSKFTSSPNVLEVGIEGAETATCVLAYGVDATAADVEAVVTMRLAEVKALQLTFHSTVDDSTKIAAKHTQLAAVEIFAR